MINKTKVKKSNFAILDSDPSTIVKNIQKGITTIENLNQQVNQENQEAENSNNIIVKTVEDNLVHNYFHYFDLYWDAGDVMSSAIIRLPKTDQGNTQYWIKYTGEVEIYIGANVGKDIKQTSENNTSTSTEYWNMVGMKSLFRGEVGQIKEYVDVLEIHIDSIGKRFKQKIPDEFRQSYINNQNVRDAFQAICEFLGVKYICPPQTEPPVEDEAVETNSASTDGTENNVTNAADAEKSMANRASAVANAAANAAANSTSNNSTNPSGNDNPDDPNATDDTENQSLTTAETESPQNGYADISFDANGAITHGSTVIETSPDMAETLIAMTEHPLQKYMEDTTYVAADVKKLLSGEFFETVHGPTMNYDSITIEPKSSSSSEMSTTDTGTTGTTGDTNSNGSNGSGSNGSGSSSGSGGTTARGVGYVHKVTPQPTARAIAGHRAPTVEEKVNSRAKNPFQAISQLIWRR